MLADRRPQAVGGSVLWAYNEGGLLGVVGVFWGNFNVYSVKIRAAEGSRCHCKCHIRGVDRHGIAVGNGIAFVVEIQGVRWRGSEVGKPCLLGICRELVHDLPADGVVDCGGIGFETLADEAESRDDRETKNTHCDDHFDERKSLPSRLRALASCFFGMARRIGHWEGFRFR